MATIAQAFEIHCASIRNALFLCFSDSRHAPSRRRQEGISTLVEAYQNTFVQGQMFAELTLKWTPGATCDFVSKLLLTRCTAQEQRLLCETPPVIAANEALFDDRRIHKTMPPSMISCLTCYQRFSA